MNLDSTTLQIGSVPQYFFDDAVIEQVQDITRNWHRPEKTSGPLITSDQPWEFVTYFTCNAWNVHYDRNEEIFRCWYEDWKVHPKALLEDGYTDNLGRGAFKPPYGSRMCYAVSEDTRTWEKPGLDYLHEKGHNTNVVLGCDEFGSVHAPSVLDDPLEEDPEKRYKMIFDHKGENKWRLPRIASSPDGKRWDVWEEAPSFGWMGPDSGVLQLEDVFILAADPWSRTYRLTTRHGFQQQAPNYRRDHPRTNSTLKPYFPLDWSGMNKRRIFQSISGDLLNWSMPQSILTPEDGIDNLDDTYYGMAQMELGDFWVGFLNVFHQVSNTMDVRLVFSRDGWNWSPTNQSQPWLRTTPGEWDSCMVNIPNSPIEKEDETMVFYGGARNHHEWWLKGLQEGLEVSEAHDINEVSYGLGMATLRRNGFVSLDAGSVRQGIIITRPLAIQGQNLVINAECGDGGFVQCELTDANGNVVQGCERDKCEIFRGDETYYTVRWQGGGPEKLPNRPRIRFFMANASLYSFQFV